MRKADMVIILTKAAEVSGRTEFVIICSPCKAMAAGMLSTKS